MDRKELGKIDMVILCGGLGTRLRPVIADRPKILATFHGQVFLDWLLNKLQAQGFKKFILSVGYRREQIIEHCQNLPPADRQILFAVETEPLGTGGALKNAIKFVKSDLFIAANGDSFWDIDFSHFYQQHLDNNSLVSIGLAKRTKVNSSLISISNADQIVQYSEKDPSAVQGFKNAGVYIMNREIVNYFPDQDKFSLEYDVFPKLVDKSFYGYVLEGEFLDFGTPENYFRAINELV